VCVCLGEGGVGKELVVLLLWVLRLVCVCVCVYGHSVCGMKWRCDGCRGLCVCMCCVCVCVFRIEG